MLTPDEAETLVGHAVGGVCPFGVNEGVTVYLDESLKSDTGDGGKRSGAPGI